MRLAQREARARSRSRTWLRFRQFRQTIPHSSRSLWKSDSSQPGGSTVSGGAAEPSSKCPPCADPPRRAENHQRVGARDQEVVVDVVAVDDPTVAGQKILLFLQHFALRDAYPARIPAMQIKMDNRQASLYRQQPRERTFARASHAGDNNTVAHQRRFGASAHGAQQRTDLSVVVLSISMTSFPGRRRTHAIFKATTRREKRLGFQPASFEWNGARQTQVNRNRSLISSLTAR